MKILGRLADVAVLTGEYEAGIQSLNRILGTGQSLLNWRSRGIALAKIGNLYLSAGDADSALEALQKGLEEVAPHGETLERAHLLSSLGLVHLRRGEPVECLARCTEAAAIPHASGGGKALASIHNTMAMARYGLGQYPEALEKFRASLKTCKDSGNRQGEAASLSNIGIVQMEQGIEDAAEASFAEAIRAFEEIGDRRSLALGLQNLSDLHFRQGNLLSALRKSRKSLQISEEINDPVCLGKSLTGYGQCLTALGEYGDAEATLSRALRIVRDVGDPREICRALVAAASLFAELAAGGESELKEALEIARRREWPYLEGLCLLQRGDISSLDRADGIFRRLGARREMLLGALRKADALIAAGDPVTSEPILEVAEGMAGANPSPALAMEIHLRKGRWLAMGEGGQSELEKAIDIARETSARPRVLEIAADLIRLLLTKGDPDRASELVSYGSRLLEEMLGQMPENRRKAFLLKPTVLLFQEAQD